MDLNPYKPGSRRNLKRPRFNQHTTKIVHDQASPSQITTSITEHSFTSHQSLKEVITTIAVAETKVVLKQHQQLYYMPALWSSPNKSITEDKEGDHAHDLLIIRSWVMTVSAIAVIDDIICNRGK